MSDLAIGNVVVLLDPFTRKEVEGVTYDALAKHTTVITDIREINDTYYGCELVFFEPAVASIVTPEALSSIEELYNVKAYFVYQNEDLVPLFSRIATCVKANYKMLEWNLIYAVINSDLAILEPYQKSKQEPLDFVKVLENVPETLADPVNRMYFSYISLAGELHRLISENAKLRETVNSYKGLGARTAGAIEELQKLLDEATAENRSMCAALSESYDVTFSGVYPDRPRVLYIKSVSHVSGIDSLLALLYTTVTRQYKTSCKVIKLVDSANAVSVRYIPQSYFPLTDSYNTYDVLTNDFLVSLGAYNLLFGLLMLNRSSLDILIVHDCRGTMGDALDPSLVDLKLTEVSSDYAVLGEYENMLSDLPTAQFVWSFNDVSKYSGTNTTKLINHPTVASIFDYLF